MTAREKLQKILRELGYEKEMRGKSSQIIQILGPGFDKADVKAFIEWKLRQTERREYLERNKEDNVI